MTEAKNEIFTVKPEERVLFIINDHTINGTTRFQKYGFLLFKQYQRELAELKISCNMEFGYYDDWKAHYYGPYSEQLSKDIGKCVKSNILQSETLDEERNYKKYSLTVNGRKKWRELFDNATDEIIALNDKIRYLQSLKTIELLKLVYEAYPKYTTKSKIKDTLD